MLVCVEEKEKDRGNARDSVRDRHSEGKRVCKRARERVCVRARERKSKSKSKRESVTSKIFAKQLGALELWLAKRVLLPFLIASSTV